NYYVFSTLVELDNVSNQIYFSVPQEFYCPYCIVLPGEMPDYRIPLLRLYEFNGTLNDPITLNRRGDLITGNSLMDREGYLGVSIYDPLESGIYLLQLKVFKSTYNL